MFVGYFDNSSHLATTFSVKHHVIFDAMNAMDKFPGRNISFCLNMRFSGCRYFFTLSYSTLAFASVSLALDGFGVLLLPLVCAKYVEHHVGWRVFGV